MINGMKTRIRKDMVQIADLTVLGKSYFRIIWDQWRVSFLSSEIITFAVILILARSGRKKNVFSGERI